MIIVFAVNIRLTRSVLDMDSKKIKQFYSVIKEEVKIAENDADITTSIAENNYYSGLQDGLLRARELFMRLNR